MKIALDTACVTSSIRRARQRGVHQHLDIGQGEVPWDDFFGTLAEVGFDGIMTACVFAWEERAEDSSRFMRQETQNYVDKSWDAVSLEMEDLTMSVDAGIKTSVGALKQTISL